MKRFYLRSVRRDGEVGPAFYVHYDKAFGDHKLWCALRGARSWTSREAAEKHLEACSREVEDELEVYEHVPTPRVKTGMDELRGLLRLPL